MNESYHKYFRMGIVLAMAFPGTMKGDGPLVEAARRIALDDYFDAVEVPYILDAQMRDAVRDICQSAKCGLAIGAQPRLLTTGSNINDLDDTRREAALGHLKAAVDQAVQLGTDSVAYLSGPYDEARFGDCYAALHKSTDALCAYAAKKGVNIALEVFDYDVDKKSIIGPTALAKRFAEEVRARHDNFGLLVDLSHIPLMHESIEEALPPVKEYVVHLHVGNAVCGAGDAAYGDLHPRFGFPGGSNDVEELAAFLRCALNCGLIGNGRRPLLSFEVKPWGGEDPEAVIANAKRTMNLAWALV